MSQKNNVDRMARTLFYTGVAVMLGFIAWVNVAPYTTQASNPAWWDPEMAQAAGIAIILLALAILMSVVSAFWKQEGAAASEMDGGEVDV